MKNYTITVNGNVYDVTVDKPAQNQAKNVAGCLAYVNGSYNNGIYEYQIGVNIDGMLELKNGEYAIKDGQKTELENTLVHELMHGLMDDYVIFDLETTGFSPVTDRIIEIGGKN